MFLIHRTQDSTTLFPTDTFSWQTVVGFAWQKHFLTTWY